MGPDSEAPEPPGGNLTALSAAAQAGHGCQTGTASGPGAAAPAASPRQPAGAAALAELSPNLPPDVLELFGVSDLPSLMSGDPPEAQGRSRKRARAAVDYRAMAEGRSVRAGCPASEPSIEAAAGAAVTAAAPGSKASSKQAACLPPLQPWTKSEPYGNM